MNKLTPYALRIMKPMTISLEEICTLVSLTLGIKNVKGSDKLVEELAAQSLDMVRIATAIDRKYDLFLDETEVAQIVTVNDLHQRVVELNKTR